MPTRFRRKSAAMLLTVAVLATGCTDALKDEGKKRDGDGKDSTEVVKAWPETDVAGTATSPIRPDLSIDVHDVIRSGDGLSTVVFDVDNQGNDDLRLYHLVGEETLHNVTLFDSGENVRYKPVQTEDGGLCLCSINTKLPAGATTVLYATFSGLPDDTGNVRVTVPGFTPVDGVEVQGFGPFAAAGGSTMTMAADHELSIRVQSISRGDDDGTVVRLEYRNDGADPASATDFPDAGSLVLVDPDKLVAYEGRTISSSTVISEPPDAPVDGGRTFTRDLLVAPLPDRVDEVVVRGDGLTRSFPVVVGDEPVDAKFDVTSTLDDPVVRELKQPSSRYKTEAVSMAKPSDIDVDESGPELPTGEPVGTLTSAAEPGWTFAPQQVVRVSDEQAYLVLDLTRNATDDGWPDSVTESAADDLRKVALNDPKTDQRLGLLLGGNHSFSSDAEAGIDQGETHTMYAAFPAPAEGSTEVTVDIPSFGRLDGVPVVDGPEIAGDDDPVQATMRASADERLRMDVLSVGRMQDDGGTLVRVRMVNEAYPGSVTTPFGFPGFDNLCRLALVNPDNGDRVYALDPCAATTWERDLGTGESLVFEVRFPNVPDGTERMVVDADGFLPSAPLSLAESASPWYLDLPQDADDPMGNVLQGSVGVADDLQTEIRSGDEVEVNLNTDVLFEFGSAILSADATARLTEIAERLTDDASGTVTISGHTDSVGDDAANLALSEQRAEAVRTVLAGAAGPSLQFEVEANGETEPIAPNDIDGRDNPDGRARNRRVTVSYTAG